MGPPVPLKLRLCMWQYQKSLCGRENSCCCAERIHRNFSATKHVNDVKWYQSVYDIWTNSVKRSDGDVLRCAYYYRATLY